MYKYIKMNKVFYIIILILIIPIEGFAQNSIRLRYKDSELRISTIVNNNQSYISINELAEIFSFSTNDNTFDYYIFDDDEKLIFSDLSFFIVYQNMSIMRVAQMSQPSIMLHNELFIPIFSFFEVMDSSNLIKSKITNFKDIRIISSNIFKSKIEVIGKVNLEPQTNESKGNLNNTLLDSTNITNIEVKDNKQDNIEYYKFKDEKKSERGKYVIPRSLKK
ncbi:MAG TPA: hypothetical protein PLE30_04605 [Candidatus Kapabacteria bacterium]|nr:hypothetical protein [Candidatus Kapabacteria bacterium]